jgi:hypothetical protein
MLTSGMGNWGLGLQIGGTASDPWFSHGGVNEGFVNIFYMFEKNGDGAAVMTNGDSGGQIGDELIHSIANEYNWPDLRSTTRTAIQVDPKILEGSTGTYALTPTVDVAITLQDGHLVWQANQYPKLPIYSESDSKFFLLVAPPGSSIEFPKDPQGRVTGMVMRQPDGVSRTAPKKYGPRARLA